MMDREGRDHALVALMLSVERRLLLLDPDASRPGRRAVRMQDDEDRYVDAYGQGGVQGVVREGWLIIDELIVRAAPARVRAIRMAVTGGGRMNIHDPKVQKASGVTFRRCMQGLLCLVLMQLSTTAMVEAGRTGSIALEAFVTVVAAASIVGCFVATGLEVWAMGKLGKALLDSRG